MSKTTRHPASQNLRVEISEEWARPGTICASVIWCGSHGMSRLHVCVDWMVRPFGIVIVIGEVVGWMLTAGAPATRKWPVVPESDKALWTTDWSLDGSFINSELGRSSMMPC